MFSFTLMSSAIVSITVNPSGSLKSNTTLQTSQLS
jgi:hypothetical protein